MEDIEMLSNTNSDSSHLDDLLNSLKNGNLKRFQDILEKEKDLDLDHFFNDPDLGTLLDISCSPINVQFKQSYVDLLLKHGANPNIVNRIRKKAPIHFVVQNNDFNILESLVNCEKIDLNIKDNSGSSALHYAVKFPDLKILRKLLESREIDLNIINKKGKSPLLCAVEGGNKDCILTLLNSNRVNLIDDPNYNKIKEYLDEIIPEWEKSYLSKNNTLSSDISLSYAFNLLQSGKYSIFMSVLDEKRNDINFLEGNNGSHTFLQYCCEFGLPDIVYEMLQIKHVNPNKTIDTNRKTPLMIAAYKGYVQIVKSLIYSGRCSFLPVENETVLHSVIKGAAESVDLVEPNTVRDHIQCLTLLLCDSRNSININQGDFKGNTALHYAAKQGENEMILCLLKAGASLNCFNVLNEPAFADINYKTLKKYLDSCVYTNDKLPREESYEIILNYSCLRPVYNNPDNSLTNQTEHMYNIEGLSSTNSYNTFESKSLLYMTQINELKQLIKHPVFTSFLYLKWHKILKGFFFNLLFYFVFVLCLSYYVLDVYPNIIPNHSQSSNVKTFYWWFLIVLTTILILRELVQFIISPLKYLTSLENWLEILIIYSSINIFLFAENTSFDGKVKLSVISIMSSWSELFLLFGRVPPISTYIEMLKTVSHNFLKFLAWYITLIIAFSLSFYVLFGIDKCSFPDETTKGCTLKKNDSDDDDLFSSPGNSLFKTAIMLTGEFDAASVPFVLHPGISHALFIAFLFFVVTVLFNLLNGLAVSDTQAIQSDSELLDYISRIKLIAYFETLVYNPLPSKGSIFNFNLSSCWETSFVTQFKNRITSKYINLFQEGCLSDDCEIRILPYYGNRVRMGNGKYASNRREIDFNSNLSCCKKMRFLEMDWKVIYDVKEVLYEKLVEEEMNEAERKKGENEKKLMEMIMNCNENINQLTVTVNESKAMLEKIVNRGWNI